MKQCCAIHNCGSIIADDTAVWFHPVCPHHYETFGAPHNEPDWEAVIDICKFEPRMFDYINKPQTKGK